MVASRNVGCCVRLVQSRSYIFVLYTRLARKELNFAEMWQVAVVKGMFTI